jgi:hypothetical protein
LKQAGRKIRRFGKSDAGIPESDGDFTEAHPSAFDIFVDLGSQALLTRNSLTLESFSLFIFRQATNLAALFSTPQTRLAP